MLVIKLSRKLRLLGLISVTWCFITIWGSFVFCLFFFFAAAQPHRLLQILLKGVKIHTGLVPFQKRLTVPTLKGKCFTFSLEEAWEKCLSHGGPTYPFCFYQVCVNLLCCMLGKFGGFFDSSCAVSMSS